MNSFRITALAAGLALVAGGADAACERMEKVSAVWLPIMQTTAYYVALEEGLFEKACIEIASNKLEAPNQIIDALVGARADFGPPGAAAGISMLAESKFPGTFKVFGLQGGGIKVGLINDGLIVNGTSRQTTLPPIGTWPSYQFYVAPSTAPAWLSTAELLDGFPDACGYRTFVEAGDGEPAPVAWAIDTALVESDDTKAIATPYVRRTVLLGMLDKSNGATLDRLEAVVKFAGDAFAFLDPVFSSGVMLALKSGHLAAETVHAGLVDGDLSPARFAEYGTTIRTGRDG